MQNKKITPGRIYGCIHILLFAAFMAIGSVMNAQSVDILLKGGHVIDPKNNIDSRMDVAIAGGKIVQVAPNIPSNTAKRTVDVSGMFVTPGLIDIHVHVFHGMDPSYIANGYTSLPPDGFTFRAGVTTVVDAGSAGYRNFELFKEQTIDRAETRVLAFLNIVGEGMRGGPLEQNIKDMNAHRAVAMARKYPDEIVGFKLAHYEGYDWRPTDSTVKAGTLTGMPSMIDFGVSNPPLPLEELFMKHLNPGDIFTHCYAYFPKTRDAIVDENGKVKPFVFAARERGIIFDVGHGGGSFRWNQAVPAIQQGLIADALSSDLHTGSMNSGYKDMANLMSKFMALGLSVQDVVARSTWYPAKIINRPELGNLSVGSEADVAVFSLVKGNFGFVDINREKMMGTQKLIAELTLRAGKIVYDLNGITSHLYRAGK